MKLYKVSLIIFLFITSGSVESKSAQYSNSKVSLKVLDINVWSGLDYKGYFKMGEYETDTIREKRYQALITQITTLNPDIIGVHEANKLPQYAVKLASDIGYEVFFHVGVGGIRLGPIGIPWNLREGDAILVKKKLNPEFIGRKQLSGGYVSNWATFHFSDATQVIGIKVTIQDKAIYVYATHWHSSLPNSSKIISKAKELHKIGETSEEEYQKLLSVINDGVKWRISESEKTIEFIQETARDNPFILMGDFNAEIESQEIKNLLQFDMIDAFHLVNPDASGFTWDPTTNLNQKTHYLKAHNLNDEPNLYKKLRKYSKSIPNRIDYIFVGPESYISQGKISIKSSKVVMKEIVNGVHASDHYGVFAELEINNP